MEKTLVTGWSGMLGSAVLRELDATGTDYRIAGRSRPAEARLSDRWRPFDLAQPEQMADSLDGIDVVLHLASSTRNPSFEADADGTRAMLAAAKEKGVKHVIYISIVGIDKVPYKYYQIKLATEKEIINSGVPYTILRTTQFHEFLPKVIGRFQASRVSLFPAGIRLQPVDSASVARRLLDILRQGPQNATLELGGPEVFTLGEAAARWEKHKKTKKVIIPFPMILLGKLGAALKNGGLTTPARDENGRTWLEWLQEQGED